jgi:hypothetical protein
MLVHADNKVEKEKWEMTDDGRMSVSEGMKRVRSLRFVKDKKKS